jgi:hypothetical protein
LIDSGEQRDKAVNRKVYMPDRLPGLVQHLPELQTHGVKQSLEPSELLMGEAGEYPVLQAIRIC